MISRAPWNRLLPASLQRQLGVVGPKPGLPLTPRSQSPPTRVLSPSRYQKQARRAQLVQVFDVFDLDGSGAIEPSELLDLGRARRSLGQKRGEWTEAKNTRMLERMDVNCDGQVTQSEFIDHFEASLPSETNEFDAVVADFLVVAEACRANKQRCRAAAEEAKAKAATARLDPLSPRYSRPVRQEINGLIFSACASYNIMRVWLVFASGTCQI